MRKDYHLHPNIMKHPEQFSAFVRAAADAGIGEICVTDHMPLSISMASDRIPHGRVKEYCQTVRELSKRHEGILSVKCGIEIDYHPSVLDEIKQVLDEGDFDYILASSHMHIYVKDYEKYTFNEFASMAIENSIRAVETGWFDAVSHLDMYRFAFENPHRFPLKDDGYDVLKHEADMKALLNILSTSKVRLEINPHLAETKGDLSFTYPQEQIVRWALEKE